MRLIDYLRHPSFLQRGVDFSIGVDQLARSYLDHSQHRPLHRCWHSTRVINEACVTLGADRRA
ncbi:MAG: hypothetical protein U0175_35005 [Caldilineaceae bacterium]